MYGFPEYDVSEDSIHLKKKTDDSYKCPINDVEYAYRMMNVLLQISKDQMVLQMMNLQLSQNAKKYLRTLEFYQKDYQPQNYFDIYIDIAMCYIVCDDNLPQKLVSAISFFLQEVF